MEATLNKTAGEWGISSIDIEFDSDYDGVDVHVPWAGIVHKTVKQRYKGRGPFYEVREYIATLDIWNLGSWEVTDGHLPDSFHDDVQNQINSFLKAQAPL